MYFLRRLALQEKKKILMTARVSMLLKSRASLTYFRDCVLPDRAKDLSARRYMSHLKSNLDSKCPVRFFVLILWLKWVSRSVNWDLWLCYWLLNWQFQASVGYYCTKIRTRLGLSPAVPNNLSTCVGLHKCFPKSRIHLKFRDPEGGREAVPH